MITLYMLATFVLVCPSRAGHMVELADTVSELFAKMLFFHKIILCEKSVDRIILVLNEHCYLHMYLYWAVTSNNSSTRNSR